MNRRFYYLISELALFLGFIVLCKLASGSTTSQAILTEDLAHPPKLFSCIKNLIEKETSFNIRRFLGPYYGVNPTTGKKDPSIAEYLILQKESSKLPNPKINFFSVDGSRWRYFSYETSGSIHVGVISRSLKMDFTLIDSDGLSLSLDLTPCKRYIVY